MKGTPITEALSDDAKLWLLFIWFWSRAEQGTLTKDTFNKLWNTWRSHAERNDMEVDHLTAGISQYFKRLLPSVVPNITPEQLFNGSDQ